MGDDGRCANCAERRKGRAAASWGNQVGVYHNRVTLDQRAARSEASVHQVTELRVPSQIIDRSSRGITLRAADKPWCASGRWQHCCEQATTCNSQGCSQATEHISGGRVVAGGLLGARTAGPRARKGGRSRKAESGLPAGLARQGLACWRSAPGASK